MFERQFQENLKSSFQLHGERFVKNLLEPFFSSISNPNGVLSFKLPGAKIFLPPGLLKSPGFFMISRNDM